MDNSLSRSFRQLPDLNDFRDCPSVIQLAFFCTIYVLHDVCQDFRKKLPSISAGAPCIK